MILEDGNARERGQVGEDGVGDLAGQMRRQGASVFVFLGWVTVPSTVIFALHCAVIDFDQDCTSFSKRIFIRLGKWSKKSMHVHNRHQFQSRHPVSYHLEEKKITGKERACR